MDKKEKKYIDVDTAVEMALGYFTRLFPSYKIDVRLEEVERDMKYWHVTFGYTDQITTGVIAIPRNERQYKTISILLDTGEFVSAKIRSISGD